jgi:hypothetical protein
MSIRHRVATVTAAGIVALMAATGTASAAGAKTPGPYSPSAVGPQSPSANGNGGGHAWGRPCAGCVGNADVMNPPGQLPDASDPNLGYECDGNSGVGLTNPAHSGCYGGGGDDGGDDGGLT